MHKQHEDQPSNELPDLSTWHLVHVGATIPKGTPYAYAYTGGVTVSDGLFKDITVQHGSNYTYYTEHPVTRPLPTEDGATILASSGDWPPFVLLIREGDRWVNCFGVEWTVKITSWCPVTVGETVVMR